MTQIINGYAQPDIVAEKDGVTRYIFVETPLSKNLRSVWKTAELLSRRLGIKPVLTIHPRSGLFK